MISIKHTCLAFALCLSPLAAGAVAPVQVVKTDAGITAWLIEDHTLPIVTLRGIFAKSGAAYSDPAHPGENAPGLPLFAVSALSEGAGDLSGEAFSAALQDAAINLDFSVDQDHVSVSLEALTEHFAHGLDLAGSALLHPRLEAGDLARLRQELSTARQIKLQQPAYLADRLFKKTAFGSHPYAAPLYGDPSQLAGYDAARIRNYLAAVLHRDGFLLAVVGDITPEQLKLDLDHGFAELPGGDSGMVLAPAPIAESRDTVHEDAAFPQTVAVFAVPGIARNDPDFYAAYLMNYLFGGGGLDGRLATEVRKKRGLTYSIGSGLVLDDAANLLKGSLSTRNEQADAAVAVVRQVFKDAYDKGFTADELKQAKDYLTGSFPLDIDSSAALVSYLITMREKGLPLDYLEQRNGLMEKVSLADLNRAAHRLLDPAHLLVTSIGGVPNAAAAAPPPASAAPSPSADTPPSGATPQPAAAPDAKAAMPERGQASPPAAKASEITAPNAATPATPSK